MAQRDTARPVKVKTSDSERIRAMKKSARADREAIK